MAAWRQRMVTGILAATVAPRGPRIRRRRAARSAAQRARRVSTSSPCCAERQGGAAPRQQRAHQPEAGHAAGKLRQVEALAQPARRCGCATRTPSPSQASAQRTSPCALCLTALVSSSLMVSAIGIDSASGSSMRRRLVAAHLHPHRAAEGALHRPRDRLDHAGHAQRPAGADLQPVDLRDRLHLADRLRSASPPPRGGARRSAAAARPRPAGCS